MRYTSWTIIVDPMTLETRIYLTPEGDDSGAKTDYLSLDPAGADTLSGALIQNNAQRKRMMLSKKGDGIRAKFRRQ